MIVGIGSDIVNINRIEKTINKFGNKFINRCFSKVEILKSHIFVPRTVFNTKKYVENIEDNIAEDQNKYNFSGSM